MKRVCVSSFFSVVSLLVLFAVVVCVFRMRFYGSSRAVFLSRGGLSSTRQCCVSLAQFYLVTLVIKCWLEVGSFHSGFALSVAVNLKNIKDSLHCDEREPRLTKEYISHWIANNLSRSKREFGIDKARTNVHVHVYITCYSNCDRQVKDGQGSTIKNMIFNIYIYTTVRPLGLLSSFWCQVLSRKPRLDHIPASAISSDSKGLRLCLERSPNNNTTRLPAQGCVTPAAADLPCFSQLRDYDTLFVLFMSLLKGRWISRRGSCSLRRILLCLFQTRPLTRCSPLSTLSSVVSITGEYFT